MEQPEPQEKMLRIYLFIYALISACIDQNVSNTGLGG
jgi:hypothetical protein